jgi:hypothetical protein
LPDLPFSSTQFLAGVASALLLFVSGGVIYLSTVEWRDRRRRNAAGSGSGTGRSGKASAGKSPAEKSRSVRPSSGIAQARRSPSKGSSSRS